MVKILIAFHNHLLYKRNLLDSQNNQDYIPAFYEGFIRGLSDAGNDLLVYNHAVLHFWNDNIVPSIDEDTEHEILEFNPDLVILFNNSFYDLSDIVDCPIIVYDVDSPLCYTNKDLLKQKPKRFKHFVSQSRAIDIVYENFGVDKKEIVHMPFFSEIRSDNVTNDTNICFIGSKFTDYKMFPFFELLKKLNEKEKEIWKSCFRDVWENPYITKETLINKYNITSENLLHKLYTYGLFPYISDTKRVTVLSQVADMGLTIYGTPNWKSDMTYDPWLTFSYSDKIVYSIDDIQNIYNRAKIGININHHQAETGFSWRVCDIMASNACLVSEYKSDLKKLFPNIDIPTFTNKYEARKICLDLLQNENKRRDIVAQCHEIIEEKYRFKNVIEAMESVLNVSLRGSKKGFVILKTITVSETASHMSASCKKGMHQKRILKNLRFKQRLKNIVYLFLLIVGQIPILDCFVRKKFRKKLYKKLLKHQR